MRGITIQKSKNTSCNLVTVSVSQCTVTLVRTVLHQHVLVSPSDGVLETWTQIRVEFVGHDLNSCTHVQQDLHLDAGLYSDDLTWTRTLTYMHLWWSCANNVQHLCVMRMNKCSLFHRKKTVLGLCCSNVKMISVTKMHIQKRNNGSGTVAQRVLRFPSTVYKHAL